MVAQLFKSDYSEASLEIVDAIMSTAELLRQDADAATAAIRRTFPHENLDRIERLLRIASSSDSKCLALCGGYAGEVACRNLGATWSERNGAAGIEFKEHGRFIPLLELCTSRQYADLKAGLTSGALPAVPETIPAVRSMGTASPPSAALERDAPAVLDVAQPSRAVQYFEDQRPLAQGGFLPERRSAVAGQPDPRRSTHRELAQLSFICGIFALLVPFIVGPVALTLGISARRKMRAAKNLDREWMALAGIAMGSIWTAVGVIGLLIAAMRP